jgi:hypothetical protein
MKSRVNVTRQIDDIEEAARELLAGIGTDFPLAASSVGILLCYSDMDIAALARALRAKAAFDIIGCGCIANMDRVEGFHGLAATLTVLSADDCVFSAVLSEAIQPSLVERQVEAAYGEACSRLPERPGLIVAIPPYILEIMLDVYPAAFNRIAPGVPVVGGLPSSNSDSDENLTIFNDAVYRDRMVMLAISGRVRPEVCVQSVRTIDIERKRRVTKAKDNGVYRVGIQSFTDYLRVSGFPVEQLVRGNATITFVSNPLLLESEDGEFSFARTLHGINLDEGSGTAVGMIPEGTILCICSLSREQIGEGALEAMRSLKEKMAAHKDYSYSTVLAFSCIGRSLVMLPRSDVEVKQLLTGFPANLSLSGFYGYGEIGPQGTAKKQNFAYNESLILCAF